MCRREHIRISMHTCLFVHCIVRRGCRYINQRECTVRKHTCREIGGREEEGEGERQQIRARETFHMQLSIGKAFHQGVQRERNPDSLCTKDMHDVQLRNATYEKWEKDHCCRIIDSKIFQCLIPFDLRFVWSQQRFHRRRNSTTRYNNISMRHESWPSLFIIASISSERQYELLHYLFRRNTSGSTCYRAVSKQQRGFQSDRLDADFEETSNEISCLVNSARLLRQCLNG